MDLLQALVVALASVGLGALVWAWQRLRLQRELHDAKEERMLRMLVALHTEVVVAERYHRAFFSPDAAEQKKRSLLEILRSAEADEPSLPSGAASSGNIIFDTLRDDLTELPANLLEPVIEYYLAGEGVAEMMRAFYEGRYEKLRMERREEALDAFFLLGASALDRAVSAERALRIGIHDQIDKMADRGIEIKDRTTLIDRSNDDDGGT
ncbi:MAG: hypothetical protein AAGE03_13055 [Pseudomonadota bacterium]